MSEKVLYSKATGEIDKKIENMGSNLYLNFPVQKNQSQKILTSISC